MTAQGKKLQVRAGLSAPDPAAVRPSSGKGAHALYSSPEFLFRRAHQIATAAFADACRHLDLTPSQYSAMLMLREVHTVSQNELGRLIALDRSTTSLVLRSLRERRLVRELHDAEDRRKKLLQLTDSGRLLLAEAERLSAGSTRHLLASLGGDRAAVLLELLEELSASPRFDIAN